MKTAQYSFLFFFSSFFVCLFVVVFNSMPCRKFWSPYLKKATYNSRRSGVTQSYQCVQYFCVSEQWYVCQCLGFLTCTQMLMHVMTQSQRGYANSIREPALKADSRRKIPCRAGDSNPHQCYALALYQLSSSRPSSPWSDPLQLTAAEKRPF